MRELKDRCRILVIGQAKQQTTPDQLDIISGIVSDLEAGFDVILWEYSEQDVKDVVEFLKKDPWVPVFVVLGKWDEKLARHLLASGCVDVLTKWPSTDELVLLVEKTSLRETLAEEQALDAVLAIARPSPILSPSLEIVSANELYLNATGTTLSDLEGKALFDAFPNDPNEPEADGINKLRQSLESVIESGEAHTMALQRYPIPRKEGGFEERFWSAVNSPVYSRHGHLEYTSFIVSRILPST